MPNTLPFRPAESQLRLELEYGWEFLPDPTGKLKLADLEKTSGWRSARAGLSWNVQFDDLREYMGAAWYRTEFEVPFTHSMHHVLLKFGAVDYYCEVFLNGRAVGSHEGGYTPFSFDLSGAIQSGMNSLCLRVVDPPMDEKLNQELFPEMLYNEIPHGKQNWYVQNSGIWQGVRLEFAPSIYVDRIDVTPKIDGNFRLDIRLAGDGLSNRDLLVGTRLRAIVHDNVGRRVWEHHTTITESGLLQLTGKVEDPRLWGPNQPALYTVDVRLEGALQYRRRVRFGFREMRAENGKLFLNGKPFYMIAALDQDFYPETIHTPASEEIVREMMLKARHLGINVLRCHLKVAHPVYLDVANEVGMLVWAELPSWSDCWFPSDHFSYKAAKRVEQMFAEMMMRDWNHPCLVIQTLMNESWGMNLKIEEQRAWLVRTFDQMKEVLAPLGRLVIDNSACEGNFHLKSDIEDFHNYYSQPDQSTLWDDFIRQFASRASWTYSPFGDAQRTGREPLVVSEFGNWGLPELPRDLPWWFHNSFGEREVTRPDGVQDRFHTFKFDRIFRDLADLAIETQWHQFASLKYEIESMRRQGAIQGYCVTGMTDVHWEVNGLLDMWRREKAFVEDLRRLQQPDVVMANFPKHNFYSGEELTFEVVLSHYSDKELAPGRVSWSLDSSAAGVVPLDTKVQPASAEHLGSVQVRIPIVDVPTRILLRMDLRGRDGSLIAENSYPLYVFPQPSAPTAAPLSFYDPSGTADETRAALGRSGIQVLDYGPQHPESLIVASVLDREILEQLRKGRRALVLADSENAFGPECGLTCLARAGNWLDGRWFSNYNWVDPGSAPYRQLAFQRILGFESREVIPRYVLGNVDAQFFSEAIAGITLGWLQMNHPLTLQARVGEGQALITTFRFPSYGTDPYSTHLLNAYLSHVASQSWNPRLELPPAETIVMES